MAKKTIIGVLLAFIVAFTFSAPTSAEVESELKLWFVNGNMSWLQQWFIPSLFADPVTQSELYFPLTSTLPVLTLSYTAPVNPFGFSLQWGPGTISRGTSSDTDWIFGTPPSLHPNPDLQSQQPSSGLLDIWAIDLTYRFRSGEKAKITGFLGYQSWSYRFNMVDPITYTVCNPSVFVCPPLGVPFNAGLDSRYNITYTGPRVGLRGSGQLSEKIELRGLISLGQVNASADGFWNLRDLTFTQAGSGTALQAEVNLGWRPTENVLVSLGYSYAFFNASGRETSCVEAGVQCYDPSLIEGRLPRMQATNSGVTLTVSWRF